MPTFATPGPIAASVAVAGAKVQVTATDRADTVVLVEPVNEASRTDVQVASKTRVDFADGELSVKTTTAGDKSGSVAITIDLPAGSGLAMSLAHSSVRADGPVGRCELRQASGQVRLDRIDALQASIASGEVEIGRVAGPASVDGAAFADGSVTATVASGVIRIGRMAHGQAKLTNGSGNIEVGIGEGAAASVDASSQRGAVHDFVSPADRPDAPAGQVMVHARTRHGDIIIQRAAS